jgi:hypothetical protein
MRCYLIHKKVVQRLCTHEQTGYCTQSNHMQPTLQTATSAHNLHLQDPRIPTGTSLPALGVPACSLCFSAKHTDAGGGGGSIWASRGDFRDVPPGRSFCWSQLVCLVCCHLGMLQLPHMPRKASMHIVTSVPRHVVAGFCGNSAASGALSERWSFFFKGPCNGKSFGQLLPGFMRWQ